MVEAPDYQSSRLEQSGIFIGCPECDYWFSEREANYHGMTLDEYANRRASL
jgi:hypothetical protein